MQVLLLLTAAQRTTHWAVHVTLTDKVWSGEAVDVVLLQNLLTCDGFQLGLPAFYSLVIHHEESLLNLSHTGQTSQGTSNPPSSWQSHSILMSSVYPQVVLLLTWHEALRYGEMRLRCLEVVARLCCGRRSHLSTNAMTFFVKNLHL